MSLSLELPVPRRSSPALATSDQGAVLVIGLFMALLLVGALYSLRGIGDGIAHKERLQDAADVGAFTGSVVHARSLNAIGVINLIQLTQTATLQTLALIEHNARGCGGIASEVAWPWSECPPVRDQYAAIHASAREQLGTLLQAGTHAAESIRDGTPVAAAGAVLALIAETYAPPVSTPVLIERPMPLRTANLHPLCAKGAMFRTPMMRRVIGEPLLRADVFQSQPRPVVDRADRLFCPELAGAGPQVFDPPDQSGTERLQVRVVAVAGPQSFSHLTEGVRVALGPERREVAAAETGEQDGEDLGRFALAQGEYFSGWRWANQMPSDTEMTIPEENTFHMHWTARLRRLRIPMYDRDGQVGSAHEVRRWLEDEFAPSCFDAACRAGNCGLCAGYEGLETLLGASLH